MKPNLPSSWFVVTWPDVEAVLPALGLVPSVNQDFLEGRYHALVENRPNLQVISVAEALVRHSSSTSNYRIEVAVLHQLHRKLCQRLGVLRRPRLVHSFRKTLVSFKERKDQQISNKQQFSLLLL